MNEKMKIGFYALIIIIIQSILKLIGVLLTGSLSFLSETVDTLTDIAFVSILLYSLKRSQKPPDFDHMYGHFKFDPIGALIQGIILINLYIILIINAFQSLIAGTYEVANPNLGLIILIVSFAINLIFSRIMISQGKKRKSLSLQIQGLNLFQDSLRAIIVLISFLFALFGIFILDAIFSIILSIWIIIGAYKIAKKSIKDLLDVNPISPKKMEEIRAKIFRLEHVNAIHELKARASGEHLYIDVNLSVEDHISIIHAHEITKSIRSMVEDYAPDYNIECIIEMNPLGSEPSIGENLINLIHSIQSDFPEIIDFKDLNLFSFESQNFLSITIIVDKNLSLSEAHGVCSIFEKELKQQAPVLSRVITHIEGQVPTHTAPTAITTCENVSPERYNQIKNLIENELRRHPQVKGYHALEFWSTGQYCILELHVFFEGELNISKVHEYVMELQKSLLNLKIKDLSEIILHSEPIEDQKKGEIF